MISKEAGVATGTLFFYFATKEELIDTLYREIKAEAGSALRRGIDREKTTGLKLRRVCLNYIRWGMKNKEKMLFMEQFAHSPLVSQKAHDEGMSHFAFLDDLVCEGIRTGVIGNYRPELIFSVLASSLIGLIGLLLKTDDPREREILIDQGLLLFWNGLAA
jgi:AcrR family transcriptional regulator